MSDYLDTSNEPAFKSVYKRGAAIGYAEGWADCEARIIKLLESLKRTCDGDCDDCRPYAEQSAHYLTALQELIKGEQN